MINNATLTQAISDNVELALFEDIGSGDITAQLIPESQQANAKVISREDMVLCGIDWANAVFQRVDQSMKVE